METHEASCNCGQLQLTAEGDPVRVSMCHCYACQRRSGSTFAVQARFPADRVRIEGGHTTYERVSDEGEGRTFHFCPECGATVYYTTGDRTDLIAVPVGALADRDFPPPSVSVWEERMHPWVGLPADMEHID